MCRFASQPPVVIELVLVYLGIGNHEDGLTILTGSKLVAKRIPVQTGRRVESACALIGVSNTAPARDGMGI